MFTAFNSTVARAVLGTVGTALCAGLCLVAATAPAAAETAKSPASAGGRTTTVRYADLDVHTAQGRAMLDRRVQGAARSVCTSANTGPAARVEEGRCVKAAVANARPVIG